MSLQQARKPYIAFSKHLDFSVNISRYILCYRCPFSTILKFLGISLSYIHMSFDNSLTETLRNCPKLPLLDKITRHRPGQGERQQLWAKWRDQHTALLRPAGLPGVGTHHSSSSFKLSLSHSAIFGQMENNTAPEDTSWQNKSPSVNSV